jgi:hypothetical protein
MAPCSEPVRTHALPEVNRFSNPQLQRRQVVTNGLPPFLLLKMCRVPIHDSLTVASGINLRIDASLIEAADK